MVGSNQETDRAEVKRRCLSVGYVYPWQVHPKYGPQHLIRLQQEINVTGEQFIVVSGFTTGGVPTVKFVCFSRHLYRVVPNVCLVIRRAQWTRCKAAAQELKIVVSKVSGVDTVRTTRLRIVPSVTAIFA